MSGWGLPVVSPRPSTLPTWGRTVLIVPLLVAAVLVAKGVWQLTQVPGTGFDLRLRWTEAHYYMRGANPFEASFYFSDVRRGVTAATVPTYFPDLGWPEQANYPPTSTLTEFLVFGLPWQVARGYFVLLNVAACGVVAWWASTGARDVVVRLFLAGIALANLGYSQTILNGNYGIVVMAALIGSFVLRKRLPMLAGLCLGIALVKPTISAPFVLLFFADRRYGVLIWCGAYLAASTFLTIGLTGTSLQVLLAQTMEGAARFATGGYALWKVFRSLGLGEPTSLALNAVLFLIPLAILLWQRRRREEVFGPAMLAAAAVVARLFTYHNTIDNVVLTFVAGGLASRTVYEPRKADLAWLGAVTVSLLTPFVWTNSVAGHVCLYGLWTAAAIRLAVMPTMRYSWGARAVARILYPYGRVRRVRRGLARGLRFVVEPGIGLTYAWGDLDAGLVFLARQVAPGMTVWDVGANRGQTALILGNRVGPTGSVVSIEPASDVFRSLVRNLGLNRMTHVRSVEAAAADYEGSAVFTFHEGRPTQGKLRDVEVTYENPEARCSTVRTVTLDGLLATGSAPAIIKIDVEGAAAAVLRGAERLLSEVRPSIYLELHGPDERAAVRDLVARCGYRAEGLNGSPVSDSIAVSAVWCVPAHRPATA
jgi:FkbM family methyltransferase